jgi:hypothetical protein
MIAYRSKPGAHQLETDINHGAGTLQDLLFQRSVDLVHSLEERPTEVVLDVYDGLDVTIREKEC